MQLVSGKVHDFGRHRLDPALLRLNPDENWEGGAGLLRVGTPEPELISRIGAREPASDTASVSRGTTFGLQKTPNAAPVGRSDTSGEGSTEWGLAYRAAEAASRFLLCPSAAAPPGHWGPQPPVLKLGDLSPVYR